MMAHGCGQDCGAAGCSDGLVTVEMKPGLGSTYDAAVALDDGTATFTCEMRSDGGWRVTEPSGDITVHSCSASGFRVHVEGGDNRYESVDVRVSAQDGSWEGSTTADPSYYTNYPNGPECGPGCAAARITVLEDVS